VSEIPPPPELSPDEQEFNRKLAAEHPGSNVADAMRLREALAELKQLTAEANQAATRLETLRGEVNRLDRAIEKVGFWAIVVGIATVLSALASVRVMWSTDRMAHYAAESYHHPLK
jgi:hypothetical protein